jgi:putative CocE/NonD family hydrolase
MISSAAKIGKALASAAAIAVMIWTCAAEAADVSFKWGVQIPLRDGVKLSATAYLPAGETGPAPCVFTLTPYIRQSYHDRGMYFAAHGYPFLTIDVRGRGNSEGVFRPLIQEAHDGYDVVEWLARQPYCNGKIAMWGGSYAGYDQWATAKERPPHLATIVPVAAPYAGVDFPSAHRIFAPYDIQWLTMVSGRTSQEEIFGDTGFWTNLFRHWFESGASFTSLDAMVGNPSAIFQEWVSHPLQDAYWDAYNPTAADYAKISIPVLTITGMYDDDQPGALAHYSEYMKNASAESRARHFLVIGPWDHAGTRTPHDEVGGVKFGAASLLDIPKLHLDWYRFTMQDGPKPDFLKKPVAYYVTGAEAWRYADSLGAVTAESRPMYLASTGDGASDVLAAGALKADAPAGAPDHYVYDPNDTSFAALEAQLDATSLVDQTPIYARSGHEVIYNTAAFDNDVELSGFFRLKVWLAIDQKDTDFVVKVFEIRQDGSSVPLAGDLMRARYREGDRTSRLVATREPLFYDFNRFTFMSRLIKKGARLRLLIQPAQSINFEKNYNADGVVAEETREVGRPVTVTVYHDETHPSALYMPIGAPP